MEKCNYSLRHLFLWLIIMLGCNIASAQKISVTGTVSDPTGEPLIGVSITVKDSKTGTTTDIDGNYAIEVDSKATLRFSYVGYDAQDIPVNARSVINVEMKENVEMLSEVVNWQNDQNHLF